jgi:hypothetical protein
MSGTADLIRAVAALLWPIVTGWALFSFKGELRDLLNHVRKGKLLGTEIELDPRGAARDIRTKANAELGAASESKLVRNGTSASFTADELATLAAEYDRARLDRQHGDGRSQTINQIVGRMIRAATAIETFDVGKAITSSSAGERLTAYAHLIAHPNPANFDALMLALVGGESTSNGQYWAIQALSKVLPLASKIQRIHTRNELRHLVDDFPPSSDRGYALRVLLAATAPSHFDDDPYAI